MIETAQILGGFSVVVLVMAFAAWGMLIWGPRLRRLDGRVESNPVQAELASRLSLLAVAISALAAVLAMLSWIAG